jgi:hypothetical protein
VRNALLEESNLDGAHDRAEKHARNHSPHQDAIDLAYASQLSLANRPRFLLPRLANSKPANEISRPPAYRSIIQASMPACVDYVRGLRMAVSRDRNSGR